MGKITINPVTRISGFLEIEAEVYRNIVVNTTSSGLLFRGFEAMLKGHSPFDAVYFTERICGICSTAHAMASTLALENTFQILPDENGRMIRDFMHGCEFLQNHIRHIYQYTFPDYVRLPSDISSLYKTDHEDFRLPLNLNNKLVEHYFQSLEYSRLAHSMLATLGGKVPHSHGIFVGGTTVNMDASKWIEVKSMLFKIQDFIKNVMLEDVQIIAQYYNEYFLNGCGYRNLMSFGCFDKYDEKSLTYVKPGTYINGQYGAFEASKITESVRYSWYQSEKVSNTPGESNTIVDTSKDDAYSWIKAPRYKGYPMEVGPLARMWLSGLYRNGISTMDRTIARALEADKIASIMKNLLEYIKLLPAAQEKYQIPIEAMGEGLIDTTRGALGHWLSIKEQIISHYDIITPSAWNISPRDEKGIRGVVENALVGLYISNTSQPVEIGRIVRSFDPCISCGTHVVGKDFSPVTIRIV